jgi:hypothetical protein
MNKTDKHHIEFLKARENAPKALESAKQTLDLITALIQYAIIFPAMDSVAFRGNHRNEAQVSRQLPRFIESKRLQFIEACQLVHPMLF